MAESLVIPRPGQEKYEDNGIQHLLKKFGLFKEKSELDKFTDERINKSIQKYSNIIRGFLSFVSLCNAGMSVSYYILYQSEENYLSVVVQGICWTLFFALLTVCMKFYPKILIYLKPLIILFGLKTSADVAYYENTYPFHFIALVTYSFCYCMAIVIPYLSVLSSFCFILGNTYLPSSLYLYSDEGNITIVCIVVLCCGHFTISNYILESKQRSLFTELLNKKKKSVELKKILQMFPLGVIICPEKQESKNWYTNTEFDNKFIKIQRSLDELKTINVDKKDPSDGKEERKYEEDYSQTLDHILKGQHKLLEDSSSLVIRDLQIHPRQSLDSEIYKSIEIDDFPKICNIETLKVDWESEPSYLHVFIDNTSIIQLEEAKNNIKCQKIMFTSASHEFRTPLNAIINSFQIIEFSYDGIYDAIRGISLQLDTPSRELLESYSEQLHKFCNIGKHSSSLMLSLVDDILDLSKMEAGTFQINKSAFSIPEMLSVTLDIIRPQCIQKRLKLAVQIDPKLKRTPVYSDEKRIKQVLINLLSNSFKFTFSGQITIICEEVRIGMNPFIKFVVKDTGVGISEEQQTKLFQLFSMVKYIDKINPSGTGIGLTISKKYIEALGGKIELESIKDKGTSVTFFIPFVKASVLLQNPKSKNLNPKNSFHSQSILDARVPIELHRNINNTRDFNPNSTRFIT